MHKQKSVSSRLQQLNDIVNGWTNLITGNRKAIQRAKDRLIHCSDCKDDQGEDNMTHGTYHEFIPDQALKEVQGLMCKICECPASTLLRSKKYKCPIGKW